MGRIGTRAYIKNILKDPLISSITPTSKYGIERLCANIDFKKCDLIVEYGPGGGVITKHLLKKMNKDARLIAIENNEIFASALKESMVDDRLIILHDSAENIQEILAEHYKSGRIPSQKATHIISGIPFSMFPLQLKNKILKATTLSIKSEGSFIVYQFLISMSYGKKDIKRKIREYFDVFRSVIELRNVPPLRIYECKARTSIKSSKERIPLYDTAHNSQNAIELTANHKALS